MVADEGAVIDCDAGGLVDEHAQEPAAPSGILEVHQLVTLQLDGLSRYRFYVHGV
jgi:hypothetical protein